MFNWGSLKKVNNATSQGRRGKSQQTPSSAEVSQATQASHGRIDPSRAALAAADHHPNLQHRRHHGKSPAKSLVIRSYAI